LSKLSKNCQKVVKNFVAPVNFFLKRVGEEEGGGGGGGGGEEEEEEGDL
jgi:hypothetical protein